MSLGDATSARLAKVSDENGGWRWGGIKKARAGEGGSGEVNPAWGTECSFLVSLSFVFPGGFGSRRSGCLL